MAASVAQRVCRQGWCLRKCKPPAPKGAEERTDIVKLFLILSSKGKHSACTDEKPGNKVTFCTKERTRPNELRASLELLLLLEPAAAWRAGGSRGASGKGSESGPQELGRGRDQGEVIFCEPGHCPAGASPQRGRSERRASRKAKPFFYI